MGKSPLILASLAKVANPSLNITSVTKLGSGLNHLFDSALISDAIGNHYVVKCPQTQQAAVDLDVETQVLRLFDATTRARLGFKVSSLAGETKDFSGKRVVLLDYLYGSPIDITRLGANDPVATSIGLALAAIHQISIEKIRSAGFPDYSTSDLVSAQLAKVDASAATGLVPPILLDRWQTALENVALFQFRPRVIHGAISDGDFLEQDSQVSGVLNWFGLQISDPAIDFKWIAGAGNLDLLDAVRLAYASNLDSVDESLLQRAVLYSELSHAEWLLYGKRLGNNDIVDEAVADLQDLAGRASDGELPSLNPAGFSVAVSEVEISEAFIAQSEPQVTDATLPIELPSRGEEDLF